MSSPSLVPGLLPETLRMNSLINSSGVVIEHVRCMGVDNLMYEWDWNTHSWVLWAKP